MVIFECFLCDAAISGFNKELKNWTRSVDGERFLCPKPEHDAERARWKARSLEPEAPQPVDGFMQRIAKTHVDAAHAHLDLTAPERPVRQDEVGFNAPEDGSQTRYRERRQERPWAVHTFWWWIHNAIAHPLIAFLPFKPFFRLHDWTSRRMHGVQ